MTQVYTASPHAEPLPQEVQVFRDNNWSITCTVHSAVDGTLYDLATWEGWFAIKDRDTYSDAQILVLKKTTVPAEGEILTPTTDGEMMFYFVRADTKDLKAGTYFWDFGIFRGTEKVTAGKGQLELRQPILLGDVP